MGGSVPAWLESKVPLDTNGAQCCVMGGSSCVTDGGILGTLTLNDSPTASGAPAYGVNAGIGCSASDRNREPPGISGAE